MKYISVLESLTILV